MMAEENTLSFDMQKLFDDAEDFFIPDIEELPPEKTREERLQDQERERLDEINAQKRKFPVESRVPANAFMDRENLTFREFDNSPGFVENTFKEDVESYKSVPSNNGQTELPESPFELLHGSRDFVPRTSQFLESFESNSDKLEQFLDRNDMARLPNYLKRIHKCETANIRLPRYTAEQTKKRMTNDKVKDLFGYYSLIPHSLNRLSEKTSVEKKKKTIEEFLDVWSDFDYPSRPGYEESTKLGDIQTKLSELRTFMDASMPELPNRSSLVPVRKIRASTMPSTSEAPKRKLDETCDSEPIISKTIEKASLPSTIASNCDKGDNFTVNMLPPIPKKVSKESSSNEGPPPEKIQKIIRNIDPSVERERILREKRKEASQKREAVYLENQNRAKEEHAKQLAAERFEMDRRKEEIARERAEYIKEADRQEEERRQASIRKAEELRMYQARVAEKKRRLEDEKQQREVAEEFERLKRRMAEVVEKQGVPQVTVWSHWPVKKPLNWLKRKEMFFNHYNWPTDRAAREKETRAQAPSGYHIIIPHANNANTRVTPLSMPKRATASKSSSSSSVAIRKPAPVVPAYRPADQNHLEKIVRDIKDLMALSRKSIANFISLTNKEVDYQAIYMQKLRISFKYPFYISDGFYWPLIFLSDEPTNISHVKSLTVCNSFSGKYASRYLLTTPLQEDSFSKKFDSNYHDSGGDWADYSQKPGRFSKRLGYQAHYSKSGDSFDVQRNRARDKLNYDYANERREQDEFGRYIEEFNQRGNDRNRNNEYKNHITTHLRQLVQDARLDVYSLRESGMSYETINHPGTRETPIPFHWHNHGYNIYLKTRDLAYGYFMHQACARYESLLRPRYAGSLHQFNEWCFTPMLVSLHYQSKYTPYDVFSSKETRELSDRYKRYHSLLNQRKFSLEEAIKVCRLTSLDKKQWTILHDQLVSHFRDFPAIFHLMYNPKENMVRKVDKILHKLMKNEFKDRSNRFDYNNRRIRQ